MNTYRVSGLFLRRFCFSRFFGKCVHSASKALTVFLAVLLLFLAFVLPVSAASDETISLENADVELWRQPVGSDPSEPQDFSSFLSVSRQTYGGIEFNAYRCTAPNFYQKGQIKLLLVSTGLNLRSGHEYEFSISTTLNFNGKYDLQVFLTSSNGDISLIDNNSVTPNYSVVHNTVNFVVPEVEGVSDYKLVISYGLQQQFGYGTSGVDVFFMISDPVLTDLDDNTGLLNSIIEWLKEIKDKIVNGFSDLGSSIGSFFSSLGDRISGFFTDLWNNIKAKFDDLKQWFQDLGDRIQGFFVDLYNDIVDGLKKLFIPSDGYFESKKTELETFCTEHFGALYQAPTILVDFIRKFTTISPQEPAITLPAIEFNFQGKHYQLTEAYTYSFSWVNDSSHMLYYLYKFFRGFVTVVLFISFANYCKNKYYDVFKGGSSE